MWVTRKADAAIRALMALSSSVGSAARPVSLPTLGRKARVPVPFLQQILFDLRRAKLVTGVRGRVGGYVMARQPGSVTVGTVLRAILGSAAPSQCSTDGGKPFCGSGFCSIRCVWYDVRRATERVVDRISIADLVARQRAGK